MLSLFHCIEISSKFKNRWLRNQYELAYDDVTFYGILDLSYRQKIGRQVKFLEEEGENYGNLIITVYITFLFIFFDRKTKF